MFIHSLITNSSSSVKLMLKCFLMKLCSLCWLSWPHPAGSSAANQSNCVFSNQVIYERGLLSSSQCSDFPPLLSVFALPDSCVHVGDNELWAAAVFLAWEQRCNQPAGTGNQAAQARQLPSCPLLAHDPLLVLRPQREAQLHWAGGQDQVSLKYKTKRSDKRTAQKINWDVWIKATHLPLLLRHAITCLISMSAMSTRWRRSRRWRERGTGRAPPNSSTPSSTLTSLHPRWDCYKRHIIHIQCMYSCMF